MWLANRALMPTERALLVATAALVATWLLLRHRRRLPLFWRRLAQRAERPLPAHLISLAHLPVKRASAPQRAGCRGRAAD